MCRSPRAGFGELRPTWTFERMRDYFIRRLLLIPPTLIGVTVIVFLITRLVPGGPLERAIMEMRQMDVAPRIECHSSVDCQKCTRAHGHCDW